ncbi:hypothetical protein ACLBWS_05685 [Brucellaceae bacterium D45D]
MVSLGAGLLGGAAGSAATGAASGGLASGLANGSVNGLTGMGNAMQGIQGIGRMLGSGGGAGPMVQGQDEQPKYGNPAHDALTNYITALLNNGRR